MKFVKEYANIKILTSTNQSVIYFLCNLLYIVIYCHGLIN